MILHPEQVALLGAAIIVGALTRRMPRAALWIVLGGLSFAASTAWGRYDLPYPPWFTGICDALLCVAVHYGGQQRWEMRLYNLYQFSILWSLGHLVGVIEPHLTYVLGLEAINWLALLLILAAAVVTPERMDGRVHASWVPPRRLRWAQRALHAQRASPPWSEG